MEIMTACTQMKKIVVNIGNYEYYCLFFCSVDVPD